jgi:hypothetical protein
MRFHILQTSPTLGALLQRRFFRLLNRFGLGLGAIRKPPLTSFPPWSLRRGRALGPSKGGRLPFPGSFQFGDPLLQLGNPLLQRRILGPGLLQLSFQFSNPLVSPVRWRWIRWLNWIKSFSHEASSIH